MIFQNPQQKNFNKSKADLLRVRSTTNFNK
jgi:hypothetical protein